MDIMLSLLGELISVLDLKTILALVVGAMCSPVLLATYNKMFGKNVKPIAAIEENIAIVQGFFAAKLELIKSVFLKK